MSEFGEIEPQVEAWRAVQIISNGRMTADDKESLMPFIEEPFRPAIGALFDKNVVTIGSSCNIRDYYGMSDPERLGRPRAWISLDWSVLSPENRVLVAEYPDHSYNKIEGVDGNTYEIAGLFFPISPTDTPDDIGKRALELAEQFETQ